MRFVPDTWYDAALRPLLMADPVNGMYVEIAAPDVRFIALAAVIAVLVLRRRSLALQPRHQAVTLLALVVCFYVWAVVSGNGRYFIWGLLLVGPALVMTVRQMPGTLALRNTIILGVLGLQGVGIWLNFVPNVWSLRPWREGPGFALQASPLRETPATFLTVGSISYSALVPQMHPQSRWSNITGQVEIRPGLREYPALRELLLNPGPKYMVARANGLVMGTDGQPLPKVWQSIEGVLSRQQLALIERHCQYLRSGDAEQAFRRDPSQAVEEGFWFCPVRLTGTPPQPNAPQSTAPVAPQFDDVFAQVERRCPRIFPPGRARSRQIDGAVQRAYGYSDTNVYVDNSGEVYFKNTRALNPTTIGTIEQVRSGLFKFDCERIPGRYMPPWARP
jgi:hypothetical protein